MKTRIISLCMILFILIMCTTVNAEDISSNNEITSTTNLNNEIQFNQTNTEISDTTHDLTINNQIKSSDTQNVQINDVNKTIVKQDSNTVNNVKEITLSNSNISGTITVAYNKENDTYAYSELEGFPVNGANITVYTRGTDQIIAQTSSDNDGKYEILDLSNGNYTVEFNYGTYAAGVVDASLTDETLTMDYIFVPDIAIVAFSGDSNGNGQTEKINHLKSITDRVLFLESYELNNSYDRSGQWMLDYSEFILVDMFSIGNGFGIDTDLIAKSPASRNKRIAYTFGIFDDGILKGTLANWGWLGDSPHSVQNTYIGSYWQALSETNSTTIRKNMENMYDYIRYLLGETDVNPTEDGRGPLLLSNSWGIYYPGFKGNVKTPSPDLVKYWIESNPGYNADNSGSLNWMVEDYSKWNLENNDPAKILRDFEDWYTTNKDLKGSFIVIATYYEGGEVVDALIKEYEKQGRAVFSLYKATSEQPDMTTLLELAGNTSIITRGVVGVSYMYWWTTGYAERGGNYTINAYKHLNVSLINALKDISKFSYTSEYGPQNEWTAAVSMPEFEGVYGALPISYVDDGKNTVIIPEGISKHVQLTNGWAKLKELNNSDKKVSILLYGYPPGKANIGASYLDVFQSLHDMLEMLYDNGYDLGMDKTEIPTTEELNNIVSDFGNKGLWAEGLLEQYVIQNYEELTEHGQLVSETQYNKWYNELPKTLQDHVTQSWGSGLGNGSMIYREKTEVNKTRLNTWLSRFSEDIQDEFKHYWSITNNSIIISEDSQLMLLNKTRFYKWLYDLPTDLQREFNKTAGFQLLDDSKYRDEGYFLVPGKYYGNIFISVQPMRGWESQMDFHTSDLSPPQQYIAYYKYLSQIAKTNAIVHMGTHGTLEWLPGRTLGLQSTDWPFQLTETPIVYPYIVSNPGEGMTAKERSFAQVITHMTPVTSSTSIYGDYVELNDAISRYDTNKINNVEDNVLYYRELILNLTEDLGYDQPDYLKVSEYVEDYKIELANGNETKIDEARKKLTQQAKILGFDVKSYETFDDMLTKLEEYINSDEAFETWLAIIHADIEAMSADSINYGMHTLGKVWNDTELITGVISIVSSRTSILDDIMRLYYPNVTESYYDKLKQRDFNDERDIISGVLKNIVTNLVEGESVENVSNNYGVFNKSASFYKNLLEIEATITNLRNNIEWDSILNALSGGYVEPGLAADPSYSDVLPTGRSMYVSDTSKIPSKSAWQSAVNSIDLALTKYILDLGEATFPELVGEVIWGTEVLRTEGISLAQFLYLLGVRPTWDNTGTVTGTEIIPLEELKLNINGSIYNRPRIDVFATIVSNNPGWISLLTEAIEKVNALNESVNDNFVKRHYEDTHSLERLFGLPGAILEGTGVSDLLNNAGTKLDEATDLSGELASVYEARIGHSWNVDDDGNIVVKDDNQAFAYLLEHIDLLIQNLDSTWRYLDSDDYVDWFGGLLNAANVHGNSLNTILLDIRNKNNIVTNTLGEEVKREIRTTFLNPQWLQAMTGVVGGWNQMAMNFENVMKTMFTTQNYKESQNGKGILDTSSDHNAGIIGDGLLREVALLVTTSEYFTIDAQYKSYAFQSMAGWLLTSDMAGYWKTNDNSLRKELLQKYVDNANRYGVACCHHTCGNINFHEWVLTVGASLGVKGLDQYSQVYASATKNPNAIYDSSANPGNLPSTDGSGTVDIGEGINEYLNNGARGENNPWGSATAGASGFTQSSDINGLASQMAKPNGGKGSGANTDSTSGTSNGGNSEGEGNGTSSSSGSGSNTGADGTNTNSGNGESEGNIDEGNHQSQPSENQESDVKPSEGNQEGSSESSDNTGTKTDDSSQSQSGTGSGGNSEGQQGTGEGSSNNGDNTSSESPSGEKESSDSQNPQDSTVETSETTNTTESVDSTEQTSPADDTQNTTSQTPQQQSGNQNGTVQNTTTNREENTGAGEKPTDSDEISDSESSSDSSTSNPETSTEEQSADESSSDDSSTSLAGVTVVSGSSAADGGAGSTSGAASLYELVKKNVGLPPSPQSEIAFGYLVFVVILLIIFFVGFTRPNRKNSR